MLLIENVDFQLSQHPQDKVTDEQLLQSIPNISNQEQPQESEQGLINKQSAPRQKNSNTIKKTKDKPLKSNRVN